MASTKFYTLGSEWGSVDKVFTLKALLNKLITTPLDPRIELCGNFIVPKTVYNAVSSYNKHLGMVQFYGQFFDESLKFNFITTDTRLVSLFTNYIRSNQSTDTYRDLRSQIGIYEPNSLRRFNLHVRRDVVLPMQHHIKPISIWLVDSSVGLSSFLLKLGGERIHDKYRFFNDPTTRLINFIGLVRAGQQLPISNSIPQLSAPHSESIQFSRRKMRDDAKLSFKYIGDRILSAFNNISRLQRKLKSEFDGPHKCQLLDKLTQCRNDYKYWVCVSDIKGVSAIDHDLFKVDSIAIVDNRRTRVVDVLEHLVAVELLDNEYMGMIFHYPYAAFSAVFPQKHRLSAA